jgi:hypothetical protein
MTKQYDFVVTSGGIGPTHDGKLKTIQSPNLAIRRHTPLPFHHYPLSHFLWFSLVENLSLASKLLFSASPSYPFLSHLRLPTTRILASQCTTDMIRTPFPAVLSAYERIAIHQTSGGD